MHIRWLKKLVASLQIFLLVLTPQLLLPLTAYAAITGTFITNETVANVASSAIPAITFSGGVTAVAASATITITDGLAAAATDQSITIDGVVTALGNTAKTATELATLITGTNFTAGTNYGTGAYTVGSSGANVTFTKSVTGAAGNGAVTIADASYTKTNAVAATLVDAITLLNAVPANGDTVVVAGTTYTFRTALTNAAVENEVLIGADIPGSVSNLINGINGTTCVTAGGVPAAEVCAGTVTDPNVLASAGGTTAKVTLTALSAGTAGNSFTVSGTFATGANVTFLSPLAGGANVANGTVPAISFAGGVTAVAAATTITVPAGLVANAADSVVSIDGVSKDFGIASQTAAQLAAQIAAVNFTTGTNYGMGAYTVTNPSGADVTFTKNAVGAAGNGSVTIGDALYGAKAQVVTFTPASVTQGETFRGTINGTDYDYLAASGNTVATVVAALATSMDANAAVACVDIASTTITCTASSAGTAFTYAATVVDITAPSAFTVGSVVTTGGTIVSNKWNATNTGVNVTVPVANDPTLTGGTIQLQAEADATFASLGAAYTILVGDLGTNVTLSRTEANIEGLTGFSNGDNITIRAVTTDSNTNATTGTVSATSLDVDQATPTFTASRTAMGTVTLTFNENVTASDTSTTAWTVSGATVTAASQPSNGTALTLTVTGLTGTSETPLVTYIAANGTVLDVAGNEVANGANATSTDGLAPTLAEVTIVSALTNDTTPDYTFSSTEAGTIAYAGGCAGNTSASAGNNTKTFNALADGTYGSCTIRVTDSASNLSAVLSVSSFTVDATAPNTPTISTVATDNRVNSSEKSAIVVTGSAEADSFVTATLTDSASTVKTGTQQLSGGATSYSITIDGTTATALVDGNLSVSVTARDAANNTSSAGTAIVPLDTQAPVFSSVAPATNAFINNTTTSSDIIFNLDTAIVSGTLVITRTSGTADGSSPHTCTLSGTALNSGAHTLNLSDTTNGCAVAQTLVNGAVYTFVFNAADTAGNNATTVTTTNVTFDTTAPSSATLSINSGAAYINSTSVTLTISASDASSPVSEMNVYNGSAFSSLNWEAYATSKSWTLPSTEGTKTVNIRFRDSAGNENGSLLGQDTIILDTTVPVISSVSINNVTTSNNSYSKNGDTVNLTATVSDTNQADITTSMLTANLSGLGGGTAVNPTSYNTGTGLATWANLTVSGTSDGTVIVTTNALDPASNSALQGSDSILADNTMPAGSISAPANNSFANSNPNFTTSPTDTNGIASVKFQYKASTVTPYTDLNTDSSSPFTAVWTGVTLSNGTVYNLQIVITDIPGNQTTVGSVSFTFDTSAPTVTVTAPLSGSTTGSSPTLTLTTNENATCSYVLDSTTSGTMGTTGTSSHSHALSGLTTGSHSVQFSCSDPAGNSASTSSVSWSAVESSGSTINATTSNVTVVSATDGQADLPSGITSLALGSNTYMDLTSSINSASGGNITVGGASLSLANFTSGSLTGQNLSTAKVIGDQNVTVSKAVKLESGTNGQPVVITNSGLSGASLNIPDGTTILGPSTWGGTLTPPKAGSSTGSIPSGFQIGGTVFEVGSSSEILLFDTPVSVILTGVTGTVAYKSVGSSNWVQISGCSGTYASPTAPAFPGECSISNGTDTKIYTYHLTSFTALEFPAGPTNSGTPVCTETKPGGAPLLLSAASASTNEVTLNWSKAADPVTYYLVAYGTSAGSLQYGNPNAGDKNTTSYTVKGLSGGKTYYFRVRAGNNCMPGDYSNELAVDVGGAEFSGSAVGFQEGVLGEETGDEAEDVKAAEDAKGQDSQAAKTEGLSKQIADNKLLIGLIIAALAAGGIYYLFVKKD